LFALLISLVYPSLEPNSLSNLFFRGVVPIFALTIYNSIDLVLQSVLQLLSSTVSVSLWTAFTDLGLGSDLVGTGVNCLF